jgi:hypothetical protein
MSEKYDWSVANNLGRAERLLQLEQLPLMRLIKKQEGLN